MKYFKKAVKDLVLILFMVHYAFVLKLSVNLQVDYLPGFCW